MNRVNGKTIFEEITPGTACIGEILFSKIVTAVIEVAK